MPRSTMEFGRGRARSIARQLCTRSKSLFSSVYFSAVKSACNVRIMQPLMACVGMLQISGEVVSGPSLEDVSR